MGPRHSLLSKAFYVRSYFSFSRLKSVLSVTSDVPSQVGTNRRHAAGSHTHSPCLSPHTESPSPRCGRFAPRPSSKSRLSFPAGGPVWRRTPDGSCSPEMNACVHNQLSFCCDANENVKNTRASATSCCQYSPNRSIILIKGRDLR